MEVRVFWNPAMFEKKWYKPKDCETLIKTHEYIRIMRQTPRLAARYSNLVSCAHMRHTHITESFAAAAEMARNGDS